MQDRGILGRPEFLKGFSGYNFRAILPGSIGRAATLPMGWLVDAFGDAGDSRRGPDDPYAGMFAMLVELWERLRGYDRWPEVEAGVVSSQLMELSAPSTQGKSVPLGWNSACGIEWTDHSGGQHPAAFQADEESPLYQLQMDDTLTIRFNPRRADQYYVRGLMRSDLLSARKRVLWTVMLVLTLIGIFMPDLVRLWSLLSR